MRKSSFRLALTVAIGVVLLAACSFKLFKSSDDTTIVTGIQARLFKDSALKGFDIRVDSQNGIVTFSGAVGTGPERAAVERIAGQQDGVKKVVDLLSLTSISVAESPQSTPKATAVEHAALPRARSPEAAPRTSPQAQLTPAPVPPQQPQIADRNPPPASDDRAKAELQAYTNSLAQVPTPGSNPVPESPSAPAAAQDVAPPVLARPPQPSASAAPPPPAAPKPQQQVTIPDGTVIAVRMVDSIDSSRNQPGEEFAATLEGPITSGDRSIGARGDYARIRLVDAKSAGSMTGRSELQLALISVTLNGVSYPTESGYYEQHGASRGTRTAETVGGGAVVGAILGGILGRGKGAAIGSIAGAGAGTAVQASTKGQQVKVPSETRLDFTLKEPLSVAVGPSQ